MERQAVIDLTDESDVPPHSSRSSQNHFILDASPIGVDICPDIIDLDRDIYTGESEIRDYQFDSHDLDFMKKRGKTEGKMRSKTTNNATTTLKSSATSKATAAETSSKLTGKTISKETGNAMSKPKEKVKGKGLRKAIGKATSEVSSNKEAKSKAASKAARKAASKATGKAARNATNRPGGGKAQGKTGQHNQTLRQICKAARSSKETDASISIVPDNLLPHPFIMTREDTEQEKMGEEKHATNLKRTREDGDSKTTGKRKSRRSKKAAVLLGESSLLDNRVTAEQHTSYGAESRLTSCLDTSGRASNHLHPKQGSCGLDVASSCDSFPNMGSYGKDQQNRKRAPDEFDRQPMSRHVGDRNRRVNRGDSDDQRHFNMKTRQPPAGRGCFGPPIERWRGHGRPNNRGRHQQHTGYNGVESMPTSCLDISAHTSNHVHPKEGSCVLDVASTCDPFPSANMGSYGKDQQNTRRAPHEFDRRPMAHHVGDRNRRVNFGDSDGQRPFDMRTRQPQVGRGCFGPSIERGRGNDRPNNRGRHQTNRGRQHLFHRAPGHPMGRGNNFRQFSGHFHPPPLSSSYKGGSTKLETSTIVNPSLDREGLSDESRKFDSKKSEIRLAIPDQTDKPQKSGSPMYQSGDLVLDRRDHRTLSLEEEMEQAAWSNGLYAVQRAVDEEISASTTAFDNSVSMIAVEERGEVDAVGDRPPVAGDSQESLKSGIPEVSVDVIRVTNDIAPVAERKDDTAGKVVCAEAAQTDKPQKSGSPMYQSGDLVLDRRDHRVLSLEEEMEQAAWSNGLYAVQRAVDEEISASATAFDNSVSMIAVEERGEVDAVGDRPPVAGDSQESLKSGIAEVSVEVNRVTNDIAPVAERKNDTAGKVVSGDEAAQTDKPRKSGSPMYQSGDLVLDRRDHRILSLEEEMEQAAWSYGLHAVRRAVDEEISASTTAFDNSVSMIAAEERGEVDAVGDRPPVAGDSQESLKSGIPEVSVEVNGVTNDIAPVAERKDDTAGKVVSVAEGMRAEIRCKENLGSVILISEDDNTKFFKSKAGDVHEPTVFADVSPSALNPSLKDGDGREVDVPERNAASSSETAFVAMAKSSDESEEEEEMLIDLLKPKRFRRAKPILSSPAKKGTAASHAIFASQCSLWLNNSLFSWKNDIMFRGEDPDIGINNPERVTGTPKNDTDFDGAQIDKTIIAGPCDTIVQDGGCIKWREEAIADASPSAWKPSLKDSEFVESADREHNPALSSETAFVTMVESSDESVEEEEMLMHLMKPKRFKPIKSGTTKRLFSSKNKSGKEGTADETQPPDQTGNKITHETEVVSKTTCGKDAMNGQNSKVRGGNLVSSIGRNDPAGITSAPKNDSTVKGAQMNDILVVDDIAGSCDTIAKDADSIGSRQAASTAPSALKPFMPDVDGKEVDGPESNAASSSETAFVIMIESSDESEEEEMLIHLMKPKRFKPIKRGTTKRFFSSKNKSGKEGTADETQPPDQTGNKITHEKEVVSKTTCETDDTNGQNSKVRGGNLVSSIGRNDPAGITSAPKNDSTVKGVQMNDILVVDDIASSCDKIAKDADSRGSRQAASAAPSALKPFMPDADGKEVDGPESNAASSSETAFVIMIESSDESEEDEEEMLIHLMKPKRFKPIARKEKRLLSSKNKSGKKRTPGETKPSDQNETNETSLPFPSFVSGVARENRHSSVSSSIPSSTFDKAKIAHSAEATARQKAEATARQKHRRTRVAEEHSYNFSHEDALKEQERLFRESAARMRHQAQIHVESQNPAPNPTMFDAPVPDVAKRFPFHWQSIDMYARLGLHKGASIQLIKSHYRRLALVYHPDKSKDESSAVKFQAITEAYRTLGGRYYI